MKKILKMMIAASLFSLATILSGCNDATPAPTNNATSNHGDEQMWQQFQSKQATDQLDKDFQK